MAWRRDWDQLNLAWQNNAISVPLGRPTYLGYVVQQHNIRSNADGMTDGWKIYGDELIPAINNNIVEKLKKIDQAIEWDDNDYNLGQIPNLHSLVPYSMDAKKPIFYCNGADGLKGAHITKARTSANHFDGIVNTLEQALEPGF